MALINERIKERRLSLGYTLAFVADKLGVTEATMQRYESGEIKNIKHETIVELANIFNCYPSYLMGWEDDPVPKRILEYANLISMAKNIINLKDVSIKKYPLLGSIACGEPLYMSEEHSSYVASGTDINADFCLKAKGESMINARIHDGDIVFIRRQPEVENGEIAAVAIEDEATLKRFYRDGDGTITLVAENPAYPPRVFTKDNQDQIFILGKAVAFQSDIK